MNADTRSCRPCAIPRVTLNSYATCWSMADALHIDWPRRWMEAPHSMAGTVRADGRAYRMKLLVDTLSH